MIQTTKTQREILTLLQSNSETPAVSPEQTILKGLFKSNDQIYNYSINDKFFLYESSGRTNAFTVLFQVIITDHGDYRLISLKPKATKIISFFGLIIILSITIPLISSINSKTNLNAYFISIAIYIVIVGLVFRLLYWILTTMERQALEKKIDALVG